MSVGNEDRSQWLARNVIPHEPALRALLARWRLPPGLDADDIVQEVYGRLAEMASVADIRNPRTYMMGIARTTLLMHLRRSRVISIRSAEEVDQYAIADDEPSPEQTVSDRQQLHLLAMEIGRIDEPWRSAFLLRVIDGLGHREIGLRLGMTQNAVQKSNARTLSRLSAFFGRGVAIATALASIPALEGDKKFGVGFGTGTYDGRFAFSAAIIGRAGANAQFRLNAGTSGQGKIAAGAGFTFGW